MDETSQNTTTPSDPPFLWVEEPKQRSTFGIFSLCFSTLIVCVWSTVHLNIPTARCSSTRRFFVQVFWMLIALLAPEVLLFLAMNQRIRASALVKEAVECLPSRYLAKPGILARVYSYVLGRAKSGHVSAPTLRIQCPITIRPSRSTMVS
jgi:hypothetical protein